MDVEFSNITLDTEAHQTFGVILFGTPVFDITNINPEKIFFGQSGNEQTGAQPTHTPRNPLDVSRHLADFDGDGITDGLWHFRSEEIGLLPTGLQELCIVGELLSDETIFEGCRLVDAFSSKNNIPDVTILTPPPGASFPVDFLVDFIGEAFDLEEGDISENIQWFSNKNGILGDGAVIQVLSSSSSLSVGTHIIIAGAGDSGRGGGTDVSTITIGVGPPSPFMEIDLRIVKKGTTTGLEDVEVTINLFKNGGFIGQLIATSDGSGNTHLQMNNVPPADYTFDIVNVRKFGIIWDLETEPFESIVFTKAT